MRKSFFSSILLSVLLWFGAAQAVFAVPVRTHGGVNATSGYFSLKSENGGNGNLTPGSVVNVDSYLFQCKTSGTAACSTEHNNDATLVTKWQNALTVPQLNQSTSTTTHSFTLPYGQCGRIQYDQGIVGIPGAIGGWVYNFGVDCANPTPPPQNNSCSSQQQVNTQFRPSGNGAWVSGKDITASSMKTGQQIDVNCFAKTGTALLENGVIDARLPNGSTYRISNRPELRNYALPSAGNYTFTCTSTSITNCSDSDSFTITATNSPVPTPAPTVAPTPQPTPSPTPSPQLSSCDSLNVMGGNDSIVPAKVTLRAAGFDNKGSIQAYRFFFGDGTRIESTDAEVTHEYTVSGRFIARVEIKDSMGNYKTSSACEAEIYVRPSNIESHKYGCSDVFISANNGAIAPSLVQFTVSGYDNKADIKKYKLDFGNGVVKEGAGRHFEAIYDRSGTYEIKAYIQNNNGDWVGGENNCRRTMTIGSSKPLTRQPSTGTPTVIPLLGFGSGVAGIVLQVAKRRLKA